jgi:eukaryotic-like serine/threonine-protein kinase
MAKYKRKEKLGSGGFCEVYKCVKEEDCETFAMKILTDRTEEAAKRFAREVRILSTLDHPRVIRVLAKNLVDLPFWYVMPLYQQSLRSAMCTLAGNEKRVLAVYGAILDGVKYAHSQGVIHRDLKPENVLLNSDEDVAISDFGLGRAMDAQTSRKTYTGEWLGTFAYMAPEQLQDAKQADSRSDIFSLGRILYELYTGSIAGVVQDLSNLPVGVAAIVEKCTNNSPDRRFQSVEEVQRAFHLLVFRRKKASAPEELQALLGELITESQPSTEHAKKATRLIAECQDDRMLLHEFAVGIPPGFLTLLEETDPNVARLLVDTFCEVAVGQSWPFAYTDQIGAACAKFHQETRDSGLKARVVAVVLQVGVSHNRFYVMDLAASMIVGTQDADEAHVLAHALRPVIGYLPAIEGRLERRKLHPALREAFDLAEGE